MARRPTPWKFSIRTYRLKTRRPILVKRVSCYFYFWCFLGWGFFLSFVWDFRMDSIGLIELGLRSISVDCKSRLDSKSNEHQHSNRRQHNQNQRISLKPPPMQRTRFTANSNESSCQKAESITRLIDSGISPMSNDFVDLLPVFGVVSICVLFLSGFFVVDVFILLYAWIVLCFFCEYLFVFLAMKLICFVFIIFVFLNVSGNIS